MNIPISFILSPSPSAHVLFTMLHQEQVSETPPKFLYPISKTPLRKKYTPKRNLEYFLLNILEPRLREITFKLIHHNPRHARCRRRSIEVVAPLLQYVVARERVVIAIEWSRVVFQFDPTAGFKTPLKSKKRIYIYPQIVRFGHFNSPPPLSYSLSFLSFSFSLFFSFFSFPFMFLFSFFFFSLISFHLFRVGPTQTHRKACPYSFFQSRTAPDRLRMWIRSKWSSGNGHSSSQSSISKCRFGGTKTGCIGDRSLPMTVAFGRRLGLWY